MKKLLVLDESRYPPIKPGTKRKSPDQDQNDFVFGMPIADRPFPEVDGEDQSEEGETQLHQSKE